MSDLLQTIKDQVAKQDGCRDWNHVEHLNEDYRLWPEVCKRYAFEVAKASLRNASENATAFIDEDITGNYFPVIVKSKIIDESNIKL